VRTSKGKQYDLDRVVHSKNETLCQRRDGLASEYIGHIVSVSSTVHTRVKVEIAVAWVVGFQSGSGGFLFIF